jgi:hypothetical protein
VSGFPRRPDRDSFGPEVENTSPVRNAKRQWGADIANLVMWQTAGMGLVCPRSALWFRADCSILARSEAWNPRRLTSAPFEDPLIEQLGTGEYRVTYTSPVHDEQGSVAGLAEVSFLWAHAFVTNADPTVLKHAQAAVDSLGNNQLHVCVFDASGMLEDGSDVVVLGW